MVDPPAPPRQQDEGQGCRGKRGMGEEKQEGESDALVKAGGGMEGGVKKTVPFLPLSAPPLPPSPHFSNVLPPPPPLSLLLPLPSSSLQRGRRGEGGGTSGRPEWRVGGGSEQRLGKEGRTRDKGG